MKHLVLILAILSAACAVSLAGPEQYSGKEMKQVATPCAEWYSDNEFNVSIWGAYGFSGTEYDRSGKEQTDDSPFSFGSYDRFLSKDHAFGGGLDAKYFFRRYFGVGVEGFALGGRSSHALMDHGPGAVDEEVIQAHDHTVGGVLGTFTLRYPFHCSRFAPYAWAGAGGVFGGYNDRGMVVSVSGGGHESRVANDDESRFVGQFGSGLEVRVTRHIGITGDFSWNVVDGPKNNFGLVRTGLNFAF